MSTTAAPNQEATRKPGIESLGWRLDADFNQGGRGIQFTPPGPPARFTSASISPPPRPAPPRCS
jgi:hypothetical protein